MSHLFALLPRYPVTLSLLRAAPQVEVFDRALEEANPAVAPVGMPILEYPWADPVTGIVKCPAVHLYIARQIADPKRRIGLDCLKFAGALATYLDAQIP